MYFVNAAPLGFDSYFSAEANDNRVFVIGSLFLFCWGRRQAWYFCFQVYGGNEASETHLDHH